MQSAALVVIVSPLVSSVVLVHRVQDGLRRGKRPRQIAAVAIILFVCTQAIHVAESADLLQSGSHMIT